MRALLRRLAIAATVAVFGVPAAARELIVAVERLLGVDLEASR